MEPSAGGAPSCGHCHTYGTGLLIAGRSLCHKPCTFRWPGSACARSLILRSIYANRTVGVSRQVACASAVGYRNRIANSCQSGLFEGACRRLRDGGRTATYCRSPVSRTGDDDRQESLHIVGIAVSCPLVVPLSRVRPDPGALQRRRGHSIVVTSCVLLFAWLVVAGWRSCTRMLRVRASRL